MNDDASVDSDDSVDEDYEEFLHSLQLAASKILFFTVCSFWCILFL